MIQQSETAISAKRSIDETSENLSELYGSYLAYMAALRDERDCDKNYAEFVIWWSVLDPVTREICAANYRSSYAEVMRRSASMLQAKHASENGASNATRH
jgi:hypothetical protein